MKGFIKERSSGHFAIVLDVRDPATGKRKRRWHSFRGTKREAENERHRLIHEMNAGTYVDPSKLTMAAFLERWLDDVRGRVSPRTFERYTEIVRKNIVPLIGAHGLTKLTALHISGAYSRALTSGRRDGRGGLSPRTVVHMHRLLKQALKQAVEWRMLKWNPAASAKPPKPDDRPMHTYDIAQTVEVIDAMRGTRLFMPAVLGILCGLRRGEIAALRWRDVNLVKGDLTVSESAEQTKAGIRYKRPKSGKGRSVALSATVVEELRAHRLGQAEGYLRLGTRLSDDSFVVALEDASPMQPTFITHEWVRLIRGTALPHLRFHDLRHAHATHLLASGVHPKIASERLGHSKIGITLDLYSHVMPGMQEAAAATVDLALRTAMQKRVR